MSTKQIAALCLSCLVLFVGSVRESVGCPGCEAPSQTLAEQIDLSQHLLLGKWVGGDKPTNESAGTVRFEIIRVAKTQDEAFRVGDTIELPQYLASKEGTLFALMGPGLKLSNWHIPCEVTQSSWEYMAGIPAPIADPREQTERLAYFSELP